MSTSTPICESQILDALGKQLDCYQRLAKLAQVQHELVQQGDAEALLGVLRRRQGVLDELAGLEGVVGPVKRGWAATAGAWSPAGRARAEAVMVQARHLLAEITASDRDDVMLLQQRKLNVGKQINQAASSRQVNHAYATAAYGKRPARMDVSR